MLDHEAALRRLLAERLERAAAFFARADQELGEPQGLGFRALFASVPRRLGGVGQQRLAERLAVLPAARPHWTNVDLARLALLLGALRLVPEAEQPGWLLGSFESGELGEQVSILRVLGALPDAARFLETGEQACRHNSLDVFQAIVLENRFLAAYFPAPSFNQAVMKAIFLQVPVRRIEELEQRITPELSRMAAGYVAERRAAGRSVPDDAQFLSQYGV